MELHNLLGCPTPWAIRSLDRQWHLALYECNLSIVAVDTRPLHYDVVGSVILRIAR